MKVLLKNLFFTILVPGTFGLYLPLYIGRQSASAVGWWNWLGVPLLAAGFSILLLCIWDFGKKGEGTPFPLDPPKNLVTGRFYQFSRNPMYVGLMMALAGWALWFSSVQALWYGLIAALIVNLFVIFVEEPILKKKFGEAYEEYCRRVPRWL